MVRTRVQIGLIRLASPGDKCGNVKLSACASPPKDDCADDVCCKEEVPSDSDDCCNDEGKCTNLAVATIPKAAPKECADDRCCHDKEDESSDNDHCCDKKGKCTNTNPAVKVITDCCDEAGVCTKSAPRASPKKARTSQLSSTPDSDSGDSSCESDPDTLDDPLRAKCKTGPSKPCRRRRRRYDPMRQHKHQPCYEANCTTRKKRRSDRTMCGCCVKSMMEQPSAQSEWHAESADTSSPLPTGSRGAGALRRPPLLYRVCQLLLS